MNTEQLQNDMIEKRKRLAELRVLHIEIRKEIEDAEEDHRLACAAYNASVRRDRRDAPCCPTKSS